MTEHQKRWYIIVLDDRRQFALHVWRYLNRALGIGTSPAYNSEEDWMPERRVLPFLDGVNRFSWLRADGRWQEGLDLFIREVEGGGNLLVMIDIMGDKGSGYDPVRVLSYLEEHGHKHQGRIHSRLISAYHVGARIEGRVLSKSRSTLNEIRRMIHDDKEKKSGRPQSKHILVTGAGFEIKNKRGGFGMLPTDKLLKRMREPFKLGGAEGDTDEGPICLNVSGPGFPFPTGGRWDRWTSIQNAADEKNLDKYWDLILAKELAYRLGDFPEMKDLKREKTAAGALLAERRMREAFRRSIRDNDWGHINQSLVAAELPWHSWFTTNYSRFADRAIALMAPLDWRTISTAAEANTSIREDNFNLNVPFRYLFKLHGDVGHLHTMAIAGYDKDTFTPLSVPVDDLYQIYASAERFLRNSLKDLSNPVVWHIVGHSLADRRLVSLVLDTCEQVKGMHIFLIMNLEPASPRGVLEKNIKLTAGFEYNIIDREFGAEGYMARLGYSGLPISSDPNVLVQWFENLPGEETLELELLNEEIGEGRGST